MIQTSKAPPSMLRGIRRAMAFYVRFGGATGNERKSAARGFANCVAQHDLVEAFLLVPGAREGCCMSGDGLLIGSTPVPWWRGQCALLAATHAGFAHVEAGQPWPWEPWEYNTHARLFVLPLFGTRWAVMEAAMLYAGGELLVAGLARTAPKRPAEQLDPYLFGLALGLGHGFAEADRREVSRRPRKALVLYEPPVPRPEDDPNAEPSPTAAYLDAAVKDPKHPVTRGFLRAQAVHLAWQALGYPIEPKTRVQTFLQKLFGG